MAWADLCPEWVPRGQWVDQSVDHLLLSFLRLERAKHPVPDDESTSCGNRRGRKVEWNLLIPVILGQYIRTPQAGGIKGSDHNKLIPVTLGQYFWPPQAGGIKGSDRNKDVAALTLYTWMTTDSGHNMALESLQKFHTPD